MAGFGKAKYNVWGLNKGKKAIIKLHKKNIISCLVILLHKTSIYGNVNTEDKRLYLHYQYICKYQYSQATGRPWSLFYTFQLYYNWIHLIIIDQKSSYCLRSC